MSMRSGVAVGGMTILVVLGLVGCDAMPGRPRAADRPISPSHVTDFTLLYRRHCAGCHGADGRLGAARPLNDPLYLALVPPERLRKIIGQGVPGTLMPAFAASAGGALTDAQIEAVVRGMAARWTRPEALKEVLLPPFDVKDAIAKGSGPGEPRRGGAVYAAACAGCHGPGGRGGPKGGPVVDAAYLALASDQALRTAVIAGRTDLGMPDWRQDVGNQPLTPQQISDVVAWLKSQRRPVVGRPVMNVDLGRQRSQ